MRRVYFGVIATLVAAAVFFVWQSIFILPEGKQALVVRLGRPIDVLREPGLKIKAPLIDTLVIYDARLLSFDAPPEQMILGDQKRMEIDSFTRFYIADPLKFYQSVRSVDLANTQLGQIVGSSFRRALGRVPLHALLTEARDRLIEEVRDEVTERATPFGIAIVQVHIRSAALPLETSQAIYDRMKSEREREAKELRAQGFEQATQIKARAEKERTVLLSEAERNSRIVRGEAEAEANDTVAQAFHVDGKFYRFYRSMQSYRKPLAEAGPTVMLSPDAEMLSALKSGPTPETEK